MQLTVGQSQASSMQIFIIMYKIMLLPWHRLQSLTLFFSCRQSVTFFVCTVSLKSVFKVLEQKQGLDLEDSVKKIKENLVQQTCVF